MPAFVLNPPCCAGCRAGLCMLALPRLRRASRLRDGWPLDNLERCAAQALEAFRAEHGAVLEARGLAADDVLAKTRIMALLVLGTRREEISFATIQVRRLRMKEQAVSGKMCACCVRPFCAQGCRSTLSSTH